MADRTETGRGVTGHEEVDRSAAGRMVAGRVQAGHVVAGRYRLLETIGAGSMGVVWRASDLLLRVEVAAKAIWVGGRPSGPGPVDPDRARVAAAVREARNAARLRGNPHVVSVTDVLEDVGIPWIIMELIAATSLDAAVRAGGPLPNTRVAQVGLAVLDALMAGQRIGLLHRDVKPANILLADDGRVLLTDFGIATHVEDTTSPGSDGSAGTPAYLAPERITQRPASVAADLFSLGATLYFAVDGEPPFARENIVMTLGAVLHVDPPPLARADTLWPVIGGLLIKNPESRLGAEAARALLLRALRLSAPATTGAARSPLPFPVSSAVPAPPATPTPPAVPAPPAASVSPAVPAPPTAPSPPPAADPGRAATSPVPRDSVPVPSVQGLDQAGRMDQVDRASPIRRAAWMARALRSRPWLAGGIAGLAVIGLVTVTLWIMMGGAAPRGAGSAVPAGMVGSWSGWVVQGPVGFGVEIVLTDGAVGDDVGHSSYPTEGCSADLRLLAAGPNTITVQERLDEKGLLCQGADRLVLTLRPGDRLGYMFPATSINSMGSADLTRIRAEGLS
ncbi:serine/threonine-protein kinase [Frankia sp. CcI49]|uniref:serine/threonine-protein kinase n=1 Tax=Frankia sp. CcI49 TaxID=1745382 RepID=UPI001F524BAD|nr:serine/threonine-protein kinase [Frankia sp. CcI49]